MNPRWTGTGLAFVLGAAAASGVWLPWVMADPEPYAIKEIHHHPDRPAQGIPVPGVPAGAGGAPAAAPQPPVSAAGAAGPDLARIAWRLPAGWAMVRPAQAQRAELQVPMPGGTGTAVVAIWPRNDQMADRLANLNRWRAAVGLPAAGADDLPRLMPTEGSALGAFSWCEPRSPDGGLGMLAALLVMPDAVLSVRLMLPAGGADPAVREAFLAFCRSLAPAGPAP